MWPNKRKKNTPLNFKPYREQPVENHTTTDWKRRKMWNRPGYNAASNVEISHKRCSSSLLAQRKSHKSSSPSLSSESSESRLTDGISDFIPFNENEQSAFYRTPQIPDPYWTLKRPDFDMTLRTPDPQDNIKQDPLFNCRKPFEEINDQSALSVLKYLSEQNKMNRDHSDCVLEQEPHLRDKENIRDKCHSFDKLDEHSFMHSFTSSDDSYISRQSNLSKQLLRPCNEIAGYFDDSFPITDKSLGKYSPLIEPVMNQINFNVNKRKSNHLLKADSNLCSSQYTSPYMNLMEESPYFEDSHERFYKKHNSTKAYDDDVMPESMVLTESPWLSPSEVSFQESSSTTSSNDKIQKTRKRQVVLRPYITDPDEELAKASKVQIITNSS